MYREKLKLSKTKRTPQMIGKVAKKINSILPNSPSTKMNVLKKVGKLQGVKLFDIVGKPKRVVSDEESEIARAYYEKDEISRVDPTFKNAKTSRSGEIQSRRHILYTVREPYSLFKEDNPEMTMGKSTFATLRPKHVKPYRDIPQNVCLYKYHENIESLISKLKVMKLPSFPQSMEEFLKETRCNLAEFNCMSSNCSICSKQFEEFFDLTRFAEKITDSIEYVQWQFVNKHFEQVEVKTNIQGALEELRSQATPFYLHVFCQKTSQSHFRQMMESSSAEKVVLQVDFAENYTCLYQNEIQSAHWSNPQVSLFTAVMWSGTAESLAIASNNISHDKFCVNVFLRKVIKST